MRSRITSAAVGALAIGCVGTVSTVVAGATGLCEACGDCATVTVANADKTRNTEVKFLPTFDGIFSLSLGDFSFRKGLANYLEKAHYQTTRASTPHINKSSMQAVSLKPDQFFRLLMIF
jgi:hypothetical protein